MEKSILTMVQSPPESDGKSTVTGVTSVRKVSSLSKIPALLLFYLTCLQWFLCITIVVLHENLKQQIFSCPAVQEHRVDI